MWVVSILILLTSALKVQSSGWGYTELDGPLTASWDGSCPTGTSQSPIDIFDTTKVTNWLPLRFLGYHHKIHDSKLFNNGHTVQVNMPHSCKERPRIFQGNLPEEYELEQLHFHWGSRHSKGSEHKLYGEQSSAELHFVHYKTSCGTSLAEALMNCGTDPEVLAVVGVMIDIGSYNEGFEPIVDMLHKLEVPNKDTPETIHSIELVKMLPQDTNEFYRYSGSLTSPGCNEIVVWTVLKNPVEMSYDQLSKFWRLLTENGEPLVKTYRPVQARNERMVYYADLHLHCDSYEWQTDARCELDYRETSEQMSFETAAKECMGDHFHQTAFNGLMPVGKLRCLRNRFSNDDDPNERRFCNRYYHVNAIKDESGTWREYPGGYPVSFSHYPEFDVSSGHKGDSLAWDALENRLFISGNEQFNALCHQVHNHDCDQCPGFDIGRECADAGDCHQNECVCDAGFTGYGCQIGPIPDKDIVVVGNLALATTLLTERVNSHSGTVCDVALYEDFNPSGIEGGMICDYIFKRGVCCGGYETVSSTEVATDTCAFYDCEHGTWMGFHDLPKRLIEHASVPVRRNGRDYAWLVHGGVYIEDGVEIQQDALYKLESDFTWEQHVDAQLAKRSEHCMVQISDCEVALIGGFKDGTTASDNVEIYNFMTNTVREGPTLQAAVNGQACGVIREKLHTAKKVIITCDQSSADTQVWDLETNEVYILSDASCPSSAQGVSNFKELDEQHLVLTNSADDEVYTFDLVNYFTSIATTSGQHDNGNSFVVPRGTAECLA